MPKLSSFKFGKYSIQSRTEANLDSDNEEVNNNSLELKDHGHKEIYHQKQGHLEWYHWNYNVQEEINWYL